MLSLLFLVLVSASSASDAPLRGLYENTGFHCVYRDSMRLPRHLHGRPQTTEPPFELSVVDDSGAKVHAYTPGRNYTVKLEGYIHMRGLLLQPRLVTPEGALIGALRGGRFLRDELDNYGVGLHECRLSTDDAITHVNDDKKFLVEAVWVSDKDVGSVQFVATVASENDLYWERFRPKSAFLAVEGSREGWPSDDVFRYSVKNEQETELNLTNVEDTLMKLSESQEQRAKIEDQIFEGSGDLIKIAPSEFLVEKTDLLAQTIRSEDAQLMLGRMFKKFSPSEGLNGDDLKFLNSHAHVQRDFVEDEQDEKCIDSPCLNGGKCIAHQGNQTCTCPNDFTGERCQFACDACLNGGRCILGRNGLPTCQCVPGMTGSKCEREINECLRAKCQNGAVCIDKLNDYKCECPSGWMGKNCDRPCRDVYLSCSMWKREGQCSSQHTHYFQNNCAASCGFCSGKIWMEYMPLPPILMPFAWLIGEWTTQVKGWNNRSADYPMDMAGMGYNETLTFSVAQPLMFGTPSINYTATMVSDEDPSNIHIHNGFLTIQEYKNTNQTIDKASLMSVSNTGIVMVEEGDITEDRIGLVPIYMRNYPEVDHAIPEKMKRWFTKKALRLVQNMVREHKGRTHKFTKIYRKSKDLPFL